MSFIDITLKLSEFDKTFKFVEIAKRYNSYLLYESSPDATLRCHIISGSDKDEKEIVKKIKKIVDM
jgi:hypothetical protein